YPQTPPVGITPGLLEGFSPGGGDPILFDASGPRRSPPVIRQKPQIVGPDAVNDTFLGYSVTLHSTIPGCDNDASLPTFFGTSAGAPHVAGAAALVMQANPAVSAAQ